MVDVSQSLRLESSSTPSTSVNNLFSTGMKKFTNKNLLLFIVLPILLFLLTIFILQWRDSSTEQLMRLSLEQPVICSTPAVQLNSSSSNKLENLFDFSRLRGRNFNHHNDTFLGPKICITSTTSGKLEDILPWIFYHKVVGITNFFLFVEGKAAAPNVYQILESIPGVTTIPRTREFEEQQANSRIWNETWLAEAFHKPCNHALFVKQTLNMEMAIVMARDAGMEWILHLDTDELLHPAGTRDYSVKELLASVPTDVDAVVFSNYESAVETDDIKEPFNEVSLFKRNLEIFPLNNSDFGFRVYKEATRPGNPSYFLTYSNGKSAARIQDHLRPNGAHRWYNYMKEPKEVKMKEAVVLHYTYSRFSDLTSRRDRCNCKPTMEDVKRCFYLKFDKTAFIIASTSTHEEMLRWYQEHVVWSDETIKQRLLNYGILTRIYTPMFIIQQLTKSEDYNSIIASAQTITSSNNPVVSNMENNSSPNNNVDGLFQKNVEENEVYYSQTNPTLSSPDSRN